MEVKVAVTIARQSNQFKRMLSRNLARIVAASVQQLSSRRQTTWPSVKKAFLIIAHTINLVSVSARPQLMHKTVTPSINSKRRIARAKHLWNICTRTVKKVALYLRFNRHVTRISRRKKLVNSSTLPSWVNEWTNTIRTSSDIISITESSVDSTQSRLDAVTTYQRIKQPEHG